MRALVWCAGRPSDGVAFLTEVLMRHKYDPLAVYLASLTVTRITLTFHEVRQVLGATLPLSAYVYPSWWANDPSRSQAKAWIDAGWATESLDHLAEQVTFVQIHVGPSRRAWSASSSSARSAVGRPAEPPQASRERQRRARQHRERLPHARL